MPRTRNAFANKRRRLNNGGYRGIGVARQVARAGHAFIRKHGVAGAAKKAWNAGKQVVKWVRGPKQGPTSGNRPNSKRVAQRRSKGLPAVNTQWDLSTERWVKTFRRKKFRRSLGQAVVYHTWQRITTGAQSIQECENLRCIMTADEVKGELPTIPAVPNRDSLTDAVSSIWDTHPNRKVTGSDIIAAQTPREDQIMWRTTDLKLTCTSLENLGQEVMIFWCVPKSDNREFPVQSWDRNLSASSFGIANTANPGYGTAMTFGSGTAGTYGFDPRTNPAWKKLWKVLKVHKFFLAPGETHKIHCEFRFNQMISKSWTEGLDPTSEFIPNHTIVPMCVVRGIPTALKQTGTDPAVTSMGYSATKVGWVFTMKHFLTYLDSTRYNYQRVNLGLPIGVPKSETRFIDDNEEPETYHDIETEPTHPH